MPRPVSPHVFAVRQRELRFATFLRQGAGDSALELAEVHSLPLAEGVFGSGPLGVPTNGGEALAESLRRLVARAAKPVRDASVVLPDAWARSMILELGELPDEPAARVEVLRFRVKRMVPYRVEDLRIEAVPIAPLGRVAASKNGEALAAGGSDAGSGDSALSLVTLANAAVCATIEDGFSRCGIRVGQLSGATLSTLQGLNRSGAGGDLFGLALVDSDGFNLVLVRAGVPVVWRQKSFTEGLSDDDRSRLLTADLRLTRTFLGERFAGEPLAAVYLAAPRAVEPFWLEVLAQGLGIEPTRLRLEHLALVAEGFAESCVELAPLAGAASREVA